MKRYYAMSRVEAYNRYIYAHYSEEEKQAQADAIWACFGIDTQEKEAIDAETIAECMADFD